VDPRIIEGGLVVGSLGAWIGLYGLMLLVTRPRHVTPLPATQDLGPEPPAVVSLVASGWELGVDAAESTLLDLGARKVFEFRQPADDPLHTTVHMRQENPTGLSPYERRVFDRVAGLTVGGVVPLTALTFRDPGRSQTWWKNLRAEVIADARARGLSRRRFSPAIIGTLVGAAVVAATGIAAGVLHYDRRTQGDDPVGIAIAVGIFAFLCLAGWAGRPIGERDTPAGREAAARWLGVRNWLRAHDAFADLPPSAVAVWDRYLPYGAAVGVTRVASAVIDLGMGDRKRVWSSYGGSWHRVRVRYPGFGSRYGKTAPKLIIRGLIAVGIGYAILRWWYGLIERTAAISQLQGTPVPGFSGLAQTVGLFAGVGLVGYGGYVLLRTAIDLAAPLTVTGQVLWLQVWQQTSGGENSPPQPTLYYLAVDDGRADRTTAWAMPAALFSTCDTGDTVTIAVRRWSRRVRTVTLDERGTSGHAAGAAESTSDDQEKLVAAMLGTGGTAGARTLPGAATPATLLTAEEVSQALGIPVTRLDSALPGPLGVIQFSSTDRNKVVLMLQVADGTMGKLAWRTNSRGDALAGIGDGAYTKGDRAAARHGDTTVLLTLLGDGKVRRQALPALLRQATARLHPPPAELVV
jgi:hypothetical protein